MSIDTELLLRLAAQRAGFTESQLDALRRHDYGALVEQSAAPRGAPRDLLDDDVGGAGTAADDAQRARLEADLARVSQRLASVRAQRDAALQLLRQLAERLGCCPQCWGTDATCATCGGRGTPGHFPTVGLLEWLGPAIAAADAARTPTVATTAAPTTDT